MSSPAQLVPLTNSPNQSLVVSVNIDGGSVDLFLYLHYNEIAAYWVLSIKNSSGVLILDSVPLITGIAPAGNILGQFGYLGIGGATVINASQVSQDYPNNTDLGSDFVLIWYTV